MSEKSPIEWTDSTWNPITGCTKVSSGCKHCYAERFAHRMRGRNGYPQDDPFRVTLHPGRLTDPLRWRKPRMIFVCSMGDLFHEEVSDYRHVEVWTIMKKTPRHTYQILTKRPERMRTWLELWDEPLLPNVWLGVSCENQEQADKRIPILLETPAAVRFISVEPMLGPLDLRPWLPDNDPVGTTGGGKFDPRSLDSVRSHLAGGPVLATGIIGHKLVLDWVICGGESGPGARLMDPDWVRFLRNQCQTTGVPFFFKQWGGAQKKRNGRVLDGRTWDGMSETREVEPQGR